MKKISVLFVALLVVSGCGGDDSHTPSPSSTSQVNTGGGTGSTSSPNIDPPNPVDLLPLVVFQDITTSKILSSGKVVVEEESFQGTGESGFDYFEVKNREGSGWYGLSVKAGPPTIMNNQEIEKNETIMSFHSFGHFLSCSMGNVKINGTLRCSAQKTTDTKTDVWQATGTCETQGGPMNIVGPDGKSASMEAVGLKMTMTGKGSVTELASFSGKILWNNQAVDLNSLMDAAEKTQCDMLGEGF